MLHSVSLYISVDGDISNVDMFEAAQNILLLNAKKFCFQHVLSSKLFSSVKRFYGILLYVCVVLKFEPKLFFFFVVKKSI